MPQSVDGVVVKLLPQGGRKRSVGGAYVQRINVLLVREGQPDELVGFIHERSSKNMLLSSTSYTKDGADQTMGSDVRWILRAAGHLPLEDARGPVRQGQELVPVSEGVEGPTVLEPRR